MSNISTTLILQLGIWILALVSLTLALYILLLNARHSANRHTSGLLALLAVVGYAVGLLTGVHHASQATVATMILASTIPALQPALAVVIIVLLKPEWLKGKWRWGIGFLYVLVVLPLLLTVLDVTLRTQLWYTGLSAADYEDGVAQLSEYAAGSVSGLVMALVLYFPLLISLSVSFYVGARDETATPSNRRLARMLFVAVIVAAGIQMGLGRLVGSLIATVVTNTVFVVAFAYAAFRQMISERRFQGGRLRFRVTVLVLGTTLPVLAGTGIVINMQSGTTFDRLVMQQLQDSSSFLTTQISRWLASGVGSLQALAATPDVISLESARVQPYLQMMAGAYPSVAVFGVYDGGGHLVASSSEEVAETLTPGSWFEKARYESQVTMDVSTELAGGMPSLVVSVPIKTPADGVVGVAMCAIRLDQLDAVLLTDAIDKSGYSVVVDEAGMALVHPDPALTTELHSLADYPPVAALRQGVRGPFYYKDNAGTEWRAYLERMENGWGTVVQREATQGPADVVLWHSISGGALVLSMAMIGTLTWLTVGQVLNPIYGLTETAVAASRGDLDRTVPVEGSDEFRVLARAFNSMTSQLRELIASLEDRVRERTLDLEVRSRYLEATAEVARFASSILEPVDLMHRVTELIRDRFDLYYVGLFMRDETAEWAVLRAGTGTAGQEMLAAEHRLRIGGASMIGRCMETGEPGVQLDVGEAAVRFENPLLPETRSELALPMRSRGTVIGAMTVQSEREAAFDVPLIAVLQTMVDQVALAIENARLISQSTAALEAARRASGELTRQAWQDLLHSRDAWGYRYAEGKIDVTTDEWPSEMAQAVEIEDTVSAIEMPHIYDDAEGRAMLAIPLKVRGQTVGALGFRKHMQDATWSEQEIEVLESAVQQLGDTLVGAQLYQAAQENAARQQLVGELARQMRQTLDIESVLRTTVQEVRQALDLPEVSVRLRMSSRQSDGKSGTNTQV